MGTEDASGDRLLTMVGIVLALAIVGALGIVVLAGVNAPSGNPDAPSVSWTVERVNETYVRITHRSGAPIERANLVVTVDGKIRHAGWSGEGFVNEGDQALIRMNDGQTLRIFWSGPPGTRRLLYPTETGGT